MAEYGPPAATTAQHAGGGYGLVDPGVPKRPAKPITVPDDIRRCMEAGRRQMLKDASKRRLCMRFERGDTFFYLDERGRMQSHALVARPRGGGKPPHRSRNRYNFIRPIIEDKVSSATQRIPGYEVDPATTDPEDAGAAKISEKVSLYGYDAWRVRNAAVDVVKMAVGMGGSGYAMPYFDPNVGPYTFVDGRWVGQGDVRIKTMNGNECYWEAGVDFLESPWWCIEQAQLIPSVRNMPGFVGGELTPDAKTSDIPNERTSEQNLVMVSSYYERPCPKWPQGRWLTIANNRVIVDARLYDPTAESFWADYPLVDNNGHVLDEPLIHRVVYTHDPDDDDDLGLTWQLIDFQRTCQDCMNKMLEYKNRGLNLQMLAPLNSILQPPDDVPGALRQYKLSPNGETPKWEPAPDAQILSALLQIFNLALTQMKDVASYEDIHADPNVAARTTTMVIQQSQARWQSFLGDLAEWHSRLMRHCLFLVGRYYTEPRTLEIRGRMGWESIRDFKGANLLGQANVRVFPGSLEYLSRQAVTSKVQYYASMGWITGQQAMTAIEGGQIEKLTEGHDLDVAKINRIINKIRDGTIMDMPTRDEEVDAIDPATGQPVKTTVQVPAWMPDDYDNIGVWRETLGTWLKTEDFENSPPQAQEVGKLMWQGLKQKQKQLDMERAQQMTETAQGLGLGNAAKPQGPPSLPSVPNAAADASNAPGPAPAPAKAPEDSQQ